MSPLNTRDPPRPSPQHARVEQFLPALRTDVATATSSSHLSSPLDTPTTSSASTSGQHHQQQHATPAGSTDSSAASTTAGPSSRYSAVFASYPDADPDSAVVVGDDIEMEPIQPAGHRRRRSSLMNPIGSGSPSSNNSHRRTPSGRSNHNNNQQPGSRKSTDPKISEEDDSRDLPRHGSSSVPRIVIGDGISEDQELSDEDLHDDEETGLTNKERRRKHMKRKRNTRLDQRIVREKITADERKEADQSVLKRLLVNVTLIGLWYLFSLCISLYNKWMFDESELNFPFPLFTTAVHMLVQFSLAGLVLYFIPSLRPQRPHRSNQGQSRHEPDLTQPIMTKMFYLTRIGPCGAATGLDIGLGNTSLKFITLTFYTMCKSSSLAFVLLFAFVFRLETPTLRLVAIIATMTVGVVMMVAGEVEFRLGGFLLVISAAFFSGFRWGLTQMLLLRNPATSNPFSSIFFIAPIMFATLFVIAIPVEGFPGLIEGLGKISGQYGPFLTPVLILFPGVIAFLMTASEFALLQRTSVVTLSIAGIFKEAVTISAAAIVFGDKLTAVNISGLFVTLGAIAAYNWMNIAKMRREAREEAARRNGHGGSSRSSSSSPSSGDAGRRGFISSSGSDAEVDEAGGNEEATGLLGRRSGEVEETLFSADGDVLPKLEPISNGGAAQHGARSDHERED